MDFHPNGMLSQIPAEERLNVFALVIYIHDPLGSFLDDLRRQLVPGCNPHAHVSVLPPRPLAVDWQGSFPSRNTSSLPSAFLTTRGSPIWIVVLGQGQPRLPQ